MKGHDFIIDICHGTGIEKETRERARDVLTVLSAEHWMEKSELKEIMGLEDDKYDNKFNTVMAPLKGKKTTKRKRKTEDGETKKEEVPVGLPVQAVVSRQEGGKAYYALSWDTFRATLRQAESHMRYCFSVDDKEAEIERLERRLRILRGE